MVFAVFRKERSLQRIRTVDPWGGGGGGDTFMLLTLAAPRLLRVTAASGGFDIKHAGSRRLLGVKSTVLGPAVRVRNCRISDPVLDSYWVRICILTTSPGDSCSRHSLRHAGGEDVTC